MSLGPDHISALSAMILYVSLSGLSGATEEKIASLARIGMGIKTSQLKCTVTPSGQKQGHVTGLHGSNCAGSKLLGGLDESRSFTSGSASAKARSKGVKANQQAIK